MPVFARANDVAGADWLEDVSTMLLDSLAGEFFGALAGVFKECDGAQRRRVEEGRVMHTYHPRMLVERVEMEVMKVAWRRFYLRKTGVERRYDGDEGWGVWEGRLYRVVKLAARATVEVERRVSGLMVEQEKETGVWGFREEGGEWFGGGMR